MKFMLILNTPKDGYDQYLSWPKKILDANTAFMQNFTNRLHESGDLVDTAGLASSKQALRVRAGKDGKPITDGAFAESKEFLAGYFILDVESQERALEIAAELSTAPGLPVTAADGSTIDHLWVEVRQVVGSRKEL
jgi:hypothetical protein